MIYNVKAAIKRSLLYDFIHNYLRIYGKIGIMYKM